MTVYSTVSVLLKQPFVVPRGWALLTLVTPWLNGRSEISSELPDGSLWLLLKTLMPPAGWIVAFHPVLQREPASLQCCCDLRGSFSLLKLLLRFRVPGAPMGLLKQTMSLLQKPQESTQTKEVRTPKAAGSPLYPPPEAQHIPAQALHTQTHNPWILLYQYGNHTVW